MNEYRVWAFVVLAFATAVFSIASCCKAYDQAQSVVTQKALERGCTVVATSPRTYICPGAK